MAPFQSKNIHILFRNTRIYSHKVNIDNRSTAFVFFFLAQFIKITIRFPGLEKAGHPPLRK